MRNKLSEQLKDPGLKMYYFIEKRGVLDVKDNTGKILRSKKDVVKYLKIPRKTLNAMIQRSNGEIKIYTRGKEEFLDEDFVLLYVSKYNSKPKK